MDCVDYNQKEVYYMTRNHCHDGDHCPYHYWIDHCQDENCCDHCQDGDEHADGQYQRTVPMHQFAHKKYVAAYHDQSALSM